jgi:hypothetical protein
VNYHQKTDKIKGDVFESGHAFKVLLICFFFIYLRGKLKRKSASKYTCECEIGWGKSMQGHHYTRKMNAKGQSN